MATAAVPRVHKGTSSTERKIGSGFKPWSWAADPRLAVLLILFLYLVLGFTVLGFNRSPWEAVFISAVACGMEITFCRLFKGRWIWPLSALITSLSLSILLDFSHNPVLLIIPPFFAIGSKYLLTFEGRHVFNPAQAGVALCLMFTHDLISAAPAYQWNGIASMSVFMVLLAVVGFMPRIGRTALVLSFLAVFTLQTFLRAMIMRHHLPFETLFLGTLTSPAFLLFSFFMITDPATSPPDTRSQLKIGAALALLDLAFHLKQSYFTFFYAGFTLASVLLVYRHARAARAEISLVHYVRTRLIDSGYYLRPVVLGALALLSLGLYRGVVAPSVAVPKLDWKLEGVLPAHSGINPHLGDVLERTDPRIQHIAKWVFSVGDSVATGDFDGDGRIDLFFTFMLKQDGERNALYRNLGDFRFERVPLPLIELKSRAVEQYGVPTNAMFVDYDNDGDQDLFITYAFGAPVLLQNQLEPEGSAHFVDVSVSSGLDLYTNSVSANFVDINRDGRLDLLIGNVWPADLPDYAQPTRLNLFSLPQPEYEADHRMFNFMHASWHMSDNGGENILLLQSTDQTFALQDSKAWGLPETRWTLAIGSGDLNQDGWTDLYLANDFGADDLYFNQSGRTFKNIKGDRFGTIGRDTYKGMNASLQDIDNNGWLDVYVSNVHHALQAEGSLLWLFGPGRHKELPIIEERATALGALNEDRFGWGAALADLDNDGWIDIVQANGMVDDTIDRRYEDCPDYWYVNEKIARSAPSIHRYADRWGDIRGMCIYGKERNRVYLNRGTRTGARFVDAARSLGLTEETHSRGVAVADLDGDGRLDVIITHMFAPPSLYRNRPLEGHQASHWIAFDLEGDGQRCSRDAAGVRVTVQAVGPDGTISSQLRELQIVDGFSAQNQRRLHFGLGAITQPVIATLEGCGLAAQQVVGLAPDRPHRLVLTPGGRWEQP